MVRFKDVGTPMKRFYCWAMGHCWLPWGRCWNWEGQTGSYVECQRCGEHSVLWDDKPNPDELPAVMRPPDA